MINPPQPQPSPPNSSYAIVDICGHVNELTLVNIDNDHFQNLLELKYLQVLTIMGSRYLEIPPEIIQLAPTLKSLTIANIVKPLILPPEFFNLTLLTTLSIINAGLTTLPEDIINLDQLIQLNLDQNQLSSLPTALGKMRSLASLSVSNNYQLSSFDVLNGSNLLKTLRASNCMMKSLPKINLNLTTIEFNGNQLTSLDGLENITSISGYSFSFANNSFQTISDDSFAQIQELHYLNLSNSSLIELPASVYQIQGLQTIDVHSNWLSDFEIDWIKGLFGLTNTTIIL